MFMAYSIVTVPCPEFTYQRTQKQVRSEEGFAHGAVMYPPRQSVQ